MKSLLLKRNLALFVSISVILCSVIFLSAFYINHSLIPKHLKGLIIQTLSEYTQSRVHIESLRFSVKNGFIFKDIKIQGQEKDEILLKIKHASLKAFFIPSLKKHRIIIPSINTSGIYLNLERTKDNNLNISYLFAKSPVERKPSAFSFILNNVYFENGQIDFSDNYTEKPFKQKITGLKGKLNLLTGPSLVCSGKINNSIFNFSGKYNVKSRELNFEIESEEFDPKKLTDHYISHDIGFIENGVFSGQIQCSITDTNNIRLTSDIFTQDFNGRIKDVQLTGECALKGKTEFDIKDIKGTNYFFDIGIKNAQISQEGNELLKNISDINASIESTRSIWQIKEVSCILYDSKTRAYGKIENPHGDFKVNMHLKTRADLERIVKQAEMAIDDGIALIELNLTYDKSGLYTIKGKSDIEGLNFTKEGMLLAGDFNIRGESSGIFKNWQSSEYKGTISFKNTYISGLANMPYISNATGKACFSKDHLSIKKMQAIALDTIVFLQGDIAYEENIPKAKLNLKIDKISLPKLISILPEEQASKLDGIELTGECSLALQFYGNINAPKTHTYNGNLNIKRASMAMENWPYNISDISAYIDFKDEEISWKALRFKISEDLYSSHGKLSGFDKPVISAQISSDKISASLETAILKDNTIAISRLDGKYMDSTFSFKGKMTGIKEAYVNTKGTAYLNLKDLYYILPQRFKLPESLILKGTIKLDIEMSGLLREPLDWILFMQGSSKEISAANLSLKDFYLDYRMKDRFVDIPVISLHAYNGKINSSIRANLKAEDYPFITNLDIKDIDLYKLIKDTDDRDKKIKGLFSSKAILNGYISRNDSLKGSGWLQVSDGYLWEFPVIIGIMNILLMTPPEYLILTDAFGNFTISNARIFTEDFKMLSKSASLLWVGSLGFDSTLDFNITGRFAENIIKQASEPGRIKSAILREAGRLIMEVRLTGTLEKPNYQIVPFPLERIFQEKIVNTIRDIFGNIRE
jgi:hypothetical protein